MKYPDLLERFQRYVQIDTQSDCTVLRCRRRKSVHLGHVVEELLRWVSDAHMD